MRYQALILGCVMATVVACGGSEQAQTESALNLPPGFDEASQVITEELVKTHVTTVASDEMEGRLPGSEGDRRARLYLAQQLQEAGFAPAFEGGLWEQPMTLVGVTTELPDRWEFRAADGSDQSFVLNEEYVGGAGRQEAETAIDDAPVVFVGYGIQAPEEQWDDYKGMDLEGAILLMLNDDPDWEEALFGGERKLWYGRWDYKYQSAAVQKAAGAIIIHTTPSAGYGWEVVQTGWTGEQFELAAGDEYRLAFKGWMTEEAAGRLVAMAGRDLAELVRQARTREFVPVELGVRTSLQFTNQLRETVTANVGGVLRGSDPELAEEYVVYSAHHDHFGIAEPDETGDAIYNGALDNGVAVAQALAMAEAFAALPQAPRRSVMCLFVAAEEQGLWGSQYFAESGVIPPGRIATNINFELGNVWGPTTDVTIYGMGKSSLDEVVRQAAATQGRTVVGETDIRSGWYYRSDHFSFARQGVPATWFKSGTEFEGRPEGWGEATYAAWVRDHYHRPSDEVEEDWRYDGLAQDAQLAFMVGASVAQADEMPTWNPGDEFEGTRERSLAELD